MLEDHSQVQCLQLEDAVTGVLLSQLENGRQDDQWDSLQYAVHEGLL